MTYSLAPFGAVFSLVSTALLCDKLRPVKSSSLCDKSASAILVGHLYAGILKYG